MSKERKPTSKEVAKSRDYHLWNISRKNRTVFVGMSTPVEASNKVNNFASLYPLYASEVVQERYKLEVDRRSAQLGFPPLYDRIEILSSAVESVISEHILGNDKEDVEKQERLREIKADLCDFYDRLRGGLLGNKGKAHDPFVRTLETKREVEIDGSTQEMDVKAVCPAAGMARQLYLDFERIIEYDPLEDPTQPNQT